MWLAEAEWIGSCGFAATNCDVGLFLAKPWTPKQPLCDLHHLDIGEAIPTFSFEASANFCRATDDTCVHPSTQAKGPS